MSALLDRVLSRHGHEADLAVLLGDEEDYTAAHLLLELVAQVAQAVHVDAGNSGSKELDAADILDLVHDIAQSGLGLFGLEGLNFAAGCLELFLQLLDMVSESCGSRLHQGSSLVHLALHLFIIRTDIVAGQGFDPADAGCDAVFRQDLELADAAGVIDVGSAAELCGEITHLDNADFVAVLLAEQSHCAALLGIVDAHDGGIDIEALSDLLIDQILDLFQLLSGHCLIVAEVETGPAGILIGTLLLDMGAEDYTQGFLHQVSRTVVAAGVAALFFID